MLVSITSTTPDATDLGYLLHKHPDRVRSVSVGFGTAHVFYPEASPQRCTATLLVDVDPVRLSRKGKTSKKQTLEPYVNDRPYVASSLLSVALGRLFGSALAGNCPKKPDLTGQRLQLEVTLPTVPVRGGEEVLRRMFEPLGYDVSCETIAVDDSFPAWGDSRYLSVELHTTQTVQRMLEHLFVLLPVLDDHKHYWIGDDEVDKLLRRGSDWLPDHPESELITRRYLRLPSFTRQALAQLSEEITDRDGIDKTYDQAEQAVEKPLSLNEERIQTVVAAVLDAGAGRVVDLGCGEARLAVELLAEPSVSHLLGVDVSLGALERAERRLRLDELSERRRERIDLVQGALTYVDDRLQGFDVATVIEVIEHLNLERLDVFTQVLFAHACPRTAIITTPNREYNVHFERLGPNQLRHNDHRFEWTRAEFRDWATSVADEHAYSVDFKAIGPEDATTGAPTQMAIFRKRNQVAA